MAYDILQSSTQSALLFLMVDSTDHVTGKTGLSPTVTISKNGGTFASPSGAVTEISGGWYKVAGNATDTNTLGPLALHATGTAADPTDLIVANIVAYNPQDSVRAGLTGIANAAAGAAGGLLISGSNSGTTTLGALTVTGATTLTGAVAATNASNDIRGVSIVSNIKTNQALTNFEILMTDSTNHNPLTGATVTVTRSIDGGAFAALAVTTVTEVSSGIYKFNLAASDLNGKVITLRATASGADDTFVTIITDA